MSWSGEVNGIYNADYTSIFMGAPLRTLLEQADADTGLSSSGPIVLNVQDADFIFPDAPSMMGGGDIDQDGLDELILVNGSYSYAASRGGVNGIFSGCEN